LTGLIEEDGGFVLLPSGVVPVLTTLDLGTEFREPKLDGDVLVALLNGTFEVFCVLAIGVELGEPTGEEDVPVLLVKDMELKVPVYVGEEEVGMPVADIEMVIAVREGVVLVPLPNGPVVPLIGATELPESVVPLAELSESVGEEDVPMSVGIVIVLLESVGDDLPVSLAVGTELPKYTGEDDVPDSVDVVKKFEELMVGDEAGVELVVSPNGRVTELIEAPEEVELNVSEEPWAQVAKRAKRR
jgi:hypothetical protein